MSYIVWTQTIESITFQILANQVNAMLSEQCLQLSTPRNTIRLPLFDRLHTSKQDIDQITTGPLDSQTITLTLEKENPGLWPHLLLQQSDEEVQQRLKESDFMVSIQQQQKNYDTIDFEAVINGQGSKTGLEM
ncbi:hypothetical protein K501DRAFT_248680 [Backusella circina FSU 941]|nr:hypothetical protein K501DRAFT_248680 [Backusella circina FSU 941]